MATNDIKLYEAGGLGTRATLPYRVQAGSVVINQGEPVSLVLGANYVNSLYNTSASSTVTTGTSKPVTGTDTLVGISMTPSSQTTSADGNVDCIPMATDAVYIGAPYLGNAFTFTANTTTSSSVISNVSSFTGIVVGQIISGTGITTGTVIASINSAASTINLSQNATATNTATVITVQAPVLLFTGTLATGVATVTSLSSIPGGLISGQVITDTTTASHITTGTTISTVGASTITMSANAVASGSADSLQVALLTSNGFNLTQAQYNALVGSTALLASSVNPITGLNSYTVLPSTVQSSSLYKNGLIIQYLDVTRNPGQIAFVLRGALNATA